MPQDGFRAGQSTGASRPRQRSICAHRAQSAMRAVVRATPRAVRGGLVRGAAQNHATRCDAQGRREAPTSTLMALAGSERNVKKKATRRAARPATLRARQRPSQRARAWPQAVVLARRKLGITVAHCF